MLVFRPQVGEVLRGKIKLQSRNGMIVTMGDNLINMVVPASQGFRSDCFWDEASNQWVWDVSGTQLAFETGQAIKVKVAQINIDQEPDSSSEIKNLMVCHVIDDGLGMQSWWVNNN